MVHRISPLSRVMNSGLNTQYCTVDTEQDIDTTEALGVVYARDAALISETTVKWASEWLHYYELWHLTGEWLAPSVGYESVAQMNAIEAESIRAVVADVH